MSRAGPMVATDRAPARAGFTLIELLVAISIIVLLTAFLGMGLLTAKDKAMQKGSLGLVNQIQTALNSYHAEFKDYPPDGYDSEPGWNVNADGVAVGTPARRVKGTAALIYFLCRPVVKVSIVGANPNDPRNQRRKVVGPFLELTPDRYSRPSFEPNHPWSDANYWETTSGGQGNRLCEIIDTYRRPLNYDKVKANNATYFQADRFHTATSPAGKGANVHPDQEFFQDVLSALTSTLDNEPPYVQAMSNEQLSKLHVDPRFQKVDDMRALVGETPVLDSLSSQQNYLEPKSAGGYDLWSYGRTYGDPTDDINSWAQ